MGSRLRVLLFETPEDPYMNLSFEEAFLIARERGWIEDDVLRIWRNANAVIIGYFQVAEEEVNLIETRKIGASIVRRFTGGGAVYHDLGNLNYAIAVKRRDVKGGVDFLYNFLLKGALNALRNLGASPKLENINDIVANDRKVSGTAGTIRGDTYFLHGCLLVKTDLAKLSSLLRVSKVKLIDKRISSVKYRVANLCDVLERDISYKELVEALIRGYEELLGAEAYFDMPSSDELKLARALYKAKYTTPEWNLLRLTSASFKIKIEEHLAKS